MGYRNPGYDEEADDDGRFEWDGERQRWLFRRRAGAAPVAVSDDEKLRCETVQRRGKLIVTVVSSVALLFARDWFETFYTTDDADDLAELTAFGVLVVMFWLGFSLVDWIATRAISDRQPVGPARTPMELHRMEAGRQGWAAYAAFPVIAAIIVWIHWPPTGVADWIWLGIAALMPAVVLFGVLQDRKISQL